MADFLEERLPIDVRMGASYADEFSVEITKTRGGSEFRRLLHPYPIRTFSVHYTLEHSDLWSRVIALYHRAFGMYAGFRVKCLDDFTTNGNVNAPSAIDQPCALVSAGVYQLQKQYGAGATPLGIGLPLRTLYKPVTGTVRVSVSAVEIPAIGWTVNTVNGQVTFAANKTRGITAITQAASAVLTVGAHTFVSGESVYISGVLGMTQINGLRGLITATGGTTITVAINSTAFSAYSGAAGVTNTTPQTGEPVKAGCEFDIPCRFNSRIDVQSLSADMREAGTIDIVELVSP